MQYGTPVLLLGGESVVLRPSSCWFGRTNSQRVLLPGFLCGLRDNCCEDPVFGAPFKFIGRVHNFFFILENQCPRSGKIPHSKGRIEFEARLIPHDEEDANTVIK